MPPTTFPSPSPVPSLISPLSCISVPSLVKFLLTGEKLWDWGALELIYELHWRENKSPVPPHPACQGRSDLAHFLFQSWKVKNNVYSLEAVVLTQGSHWTEVCLMSECIRWGWGTALCVSPLPWPPPAFPCAALHYALRTSSVFLTLLPSLHASNSLFFLEPYLSQVPYIWLLWSFC